MKNSLVHIALKQMRREKKIPRRLSNKLLDYGAYFSIHGSFSRRINAARRLLRRLRNNRALAEALVPAKKLRVNIFFNFTPQGNKPWVYEGSIYVPWSATDQQIIGFLK